MEQNTSTSVPQFYLHGERKVSYFLEFLLTAVATLVFVAYLKLNKSAKKSTRFDIASLPGPKYLIPFVGNCLQLLPISNTLNVLTEWCRKYGPLFKANLAGHTYVVLNSAESVEALLKSTNMGHIVKNPYIYKELGVYVPNGIIISIGHEWKTNRKILSPVMSIQSFKASVPKLNKHCSRLVENMKLLFKDGQPHEINTLCSFALFELIGEMIVGRDLYGSDDGKKIHTALIEAEELISQKILKPWLKFPLIWKFHPYAKKEREIIAVKDEWLKSVIAQRRQERALESEKTRDEIPPYKKNVVDLLLDSNMNDELMATEILAMFVAGHDTSATAIHFFCFLMALHPEFQTKCRQEIESVLGGKPELTWDDINNLKYLEQCLSESARLFSAVPLVSRTLQEPLALDKNRELPIGTNVLVLIAGMHRNPKYYPNPDKYDPNRFSPEEISKRPSGAYIPFSLGQRNCLGFKFAMVELKVLAAYILRNFELSTQHTLNEIPVLAKFLIKPQRDYMFSCKILT